MSGELAIFIAASDTSQEVNRSVTAEHQMEKPRVTNIQATRARILKIAEMTESMKAERKELQRREDDN